MSVRTGQIFGIWMLASASMFGFGLFAQEWTFSDVTQDSGLSFDPAIERDWTGVAAGDYDGDGWVDLLITPDTLAPNQLYRNQGDGTFTEVALDAGVSLVGNSFRSALFFDYNNDGRLDIIFAPSDFIKTPRIFNNLGNGRFSEVTETTGLSCQWQVFSIAAGDYDLDGDQDLYFGINDPDKGAGHLWQNQGDGTFVNVAEAAGIGPLENQDFNLEFTPSFADVNGDRYPDLLIVADFNNTQLYINNRDGTFTNATTPVFTDEGGMGSGIADYDNDGDLDWFVSSIWDPDQDPDKPWGVSSGNRLYRNNGSGVFEDATDEAGVRNGYWGWGSTFADLDNDGDLDLFHTNGFVDPEGPFFRDDPSRTFINNGDGTFTEMGATIGLADTGMGHGAVVLDYDGDGDLDLFIANSIEPPRLYRNDGGNSRNAIHVKLVGLDRNTQGIGARVYLDHEGQTQMREINSGNNFLSQNPTSAHFGIGDAAESQVTVTWPSGVRMRVDKVQAGETLKVPELSVSFDDPEIDFFPYFYQVDQRLKAYMASNLLTQSEAGRIKANAIKAFIQNRFLKTGQ